MVSTKKAGSTLLEGDQRTGVGPCHLADAARPNAEAVRPETRWGVSTLLFFISFFSPRPNLRRSTHHVPHSSTNPPGVSGSFFLFFTKIFRYLNGRSMAFRLRFANQRDAKGRRRSRRHGVGSFIQKDRVLCFYFLEYLSASSLFWFFI